MALIGTPRAGGGGRIGTGAALRLHHFALSASLPAARGKPTSCASTPSQDPFPQPLPLLLLWKSTTTPGWLRNHTFHREKLPVHRPPRGGGETRSDSVANAVEVLPEGVEVILVHDAARPLTTVGTVERCIEVASRGEGAVAGWPATDTLKEVDGDQRILRTPDRSRIWHAQTPQGFPAPVLRGALGDPDLRARATDDASLVEAAGVPVRMVEGSPDNLKVTRPQDLPVAELLLARRRAGQSGEEPAGAGA